MSYPPIAGVSVLGITGAARHGKDTLACALMALISGSERFAFSDAVSAVARAKHGMTTRDPRELQRVGMAYRKDDPSVWLRCLYGAIEDRSPRLALVTGVRFPDEADMIREMGGHIIKVVRTEPDGSYFVDPHRDANAEVERSIDRIAFAQEVIARSGDIQSILEQARGVKLSLV